MISLLKRLVRAGFSSVGLDVHRIGRPHVTEPAQPQALVPDIPRAILRPKATYAPWLADAAFNGIYEVIRPHTVVDLYRCYELWTLASRLAHLPGDVIEIGVWRGGTGALIAHKVRTVAPDRVVYLCDTFTGVVGAGHRDTQYKGGEFANTSVEIVDELIARLGLNNTRILAGIFPHETGAQVTANRLALVHIDVDTHDSAKWCFEWTWPRMVPGGATVFDDYGIQGCDGVTRMVNAICEPDAAVIYNLNGHAIVLKSPVSPSNIISR